MEKAELAELRTRARALQANVDGLVRLVFAISVRAAPLPAARPARQNRRGFLPRPPGRLFLGLGGV